VEYQVTLSPRAEQDLATIWSYLRERNPEAATSFCLDLVKFAFSLQTFPARNPRLDAHRDVHKIPFESYSVIYRIKPGQHQVEILRFWHAAQDRSRMRLREAESAYPAVPSAIAEFAV
jgi:plasmid stabilization system protein ParE